MQGGIRLFCILATVLAATNEPLRAQTGDATARIAVGICDKSGLGASIRAIALSEASNAFRSAGIRVDWVDLEGTVGPATFELTSLERCEIPVSDVDFVVVIARGAPDGAGREELGFAQVNARPFRRAYVLHDRVSEFVDRYDLGSERDRSVILGYVIAHELGHLMMPETGHTHGGIMAAVWGYSERSAALRGTLGFTAREAGQMRACVACD
jgi:hypothetical protein